jgi:hypothetical protein
VNRQPGQWPVEHPVDLEAIEREHEADQDDRYVQRQQERALHEMALDSICHDLRQQPSPFTVASAARNWCNRITAAAEEIAREKRSTA